MAKQGLTLEQKQTQRLALEQQRLLGMVLEKSDAEISEIIKDIFKMTPYEIERRLNLRRPIYEETATYGHMGRQPKKVTKEFTSRYDADLSIDVELFTWERLDYVDIIQEKFGITH